MPLSENEQRILDEIERRLSEEDPRFVARARKVGGRGSERAALAWSAAGFVLGLVLLLGITFHAAFGYLGAGVMFLAAVTGVRALDRVESEGDEPIVDRLRRAFSRR